MTQVERATSRPLAREPERVRFAAQVGVARPRVRRHQAQPVGRLRARLVGLDLVGAWGGWLVALSIASTRSLGEAVVASLAAASFMAVLTALVAATQQLYKARICSVRSVEVGRLARVAVVSALVAAMAGRSDVSPISGAAAVAGAGCAFLALAGFRGIFAGWLRMRRSQGRFARPVCVFGTNDEAEDLVHLLTDHPELGYRVVGVVGDSFTWRGRIPGLAPMSADLDPVGSVRALGASGVVVALSAFSSEESDRLVKQLIDGGLHVQVSSGLKRIGHRRMRVSPLAHQVMFYVEPHQLSRWQARGKRAIDVVLSSVALLVTLPVMALAALAIKVEDRGPIFYRQARVGLGGRIFEVVKLRSMVLDASEKLPALLSSNEREGPLFKMAEDPRVTRVGAFLRETSIDELPQLFNVLRGQMSLVGPRPALPSEVARFDEDLKDRADVRPGITGLWQVEARDNPSFRAYRRLDLFYVDNWSMGLDLVIMLATVRTLTIRAVRAIRAVVPLSRTTSPVALSAQAEVEPSEGALGGFASS